MEEKSEQCAGEGQWANRWRDGVEMIIEKGNSKHRGGSHKLGVSEEQGAHVVDEQQEEAGWGQILTSMVRAVVKGLAFILLVMGTTFMKVSKCKGLKWSSI